MANIIKKYPCHDSMATPITWHIEHLSSGNNNNKYFLWTNSPSNSNDNSNDNTDNYYYHDYRMMAIKLLDDISVNFACNYCNVAPFN